MTKAATRLYHISESAGINAFEPRPAPASSNRAGEPLVWAVTEKMLHHYLLPRDCPRVGFYKLDSSTPEDITMFLGLSAAPFVLAIEAAWLERVTKATLYLYELPTESFELYDEVAGYYVSKERLEPLSVRQLERPLTTLLQGDVELRIVPSLWHLRDAVVTSSLGFSCIRMRHAQPRP